MLLRLCVLIAALGTGAAAADLAVPAAARAPNLPLASPRWTAAFAPLCAWLGTSDGLRAAAGIDPGLAPAAGLDFHGDAAAAALAPLEAQLASAPARAEALIAALARWNELEPAQRNAFLKEVAAERRAASPRAAAALAERVRNARAAEASAAELDALSLQAAGFSLYGAAASAELAALRRLTYERRLAPIEEEVRMFGPNRGPEDLPSGAVAASPARLALPRAAFEAPPRFAAPKPPKSDFKVRAVTAALLVPAIIGVIHLGGAFFSAFVVVLAGLSLREYASMLRAGGRAVQPAIGVVSAVALALAVAMHAPLAPVAAGVVMLSVLRELLRKDRDFERAARTVFGAFLLGFLPAHLALIRGLAPFGERITLMLFASAWLTDTTAYVVGKRWGSHKIAPAISPNKTWEGAAAGALGAFAAAAISWAAAPAMMPWWAAAGVGLIMATAGQASGYVNSMIKRANGVKDSGNLLPGHGGVIDRFDTFILSSALVYFLLSLI